mmetsp:Transcript_18720/g.25299  ORF Transcript_18720/g.25299 Transcript_18720/m.25299 type:complete len:413 (-) Transcript_18720:542-1780(-)
MLLLLKHEEVLHFSLGHHLVLMKLCSVLIRQILVGWCLGVILKLKFRRNRLENSFAYLIVVERQAELGISAHSLPIDLRRRAAGLYWTGLRRGNHARASLLMRRHQLPLKVAIVEIFDEFVCRFNATELHNNLVLGQLHIAVFDLVRRNDGLERVDKFAGVVPLHARGANHDCRLFDAWRFHDTRPFKVFSLILDRSHRASHVSRRELEVSRNEGAGGNTLTCLQSRRTNAQLCALGRLLVGPNFFDLLKIFFSSVCGFTILVDEGHPTRDLMDILLGNAAASFFRLTVSPSSPVLRLHRVPGRRRRGIDLFDASREAASIVGASVGADGSGLLRSRIRDRRAHEAERCPLERVILRLARATVTRQLLAPLMTAQRLIKLETAVGHGLRTDKARLLKGLGRAEIFLVVSAIL